MEKVLFIAYQFPPQAGAGVHRSLRLARALPDLGYEPIVVTTTIEGMKAEGRKIDESLMNHLPKEMEIHRLKAHSPMKFIRFCMKLKIYRLIWYLFYPILWEQSHFWAKRNYKKVEALVHKHDIKIIYTSSGPFSSMLLGRKLQKNLGIKWVADLRDPFSDAYFWQFPSKMHWNKARKKERKLFGKPDHLIVNTHEVKKIYLKRNYISTEKISVVNNGY